MKAVMPIALPEVLRLRQRTGADRFDEMWEGVLHMAPAPDRRHQIITLGVTRFLADVWEPRSGGTVLPQVNVSTPERWPTDYRIPDVAIMAAGAVLAAETRFERPVVVIEVRSPDDETYDKLDFYAEVGVLSLVVIERDTRAAQVFRASGGKLIVVAPRSDGWISVDPIGVEIRTEELASGPVLRLRLAGEPKTERTV